MIGRARVRRNGLTLGLVTEKGKGLVAHLLWREWKRRLVVVVEEGCHPQIKPGKETTNFIKEHLNKAREREMENPRRRKRSVPAPSPVKIPGFTPTDLAVAELLIHISSSSGDSSAATAPQRSVSSALSSSSSPLSVASVARPPIPGPSHFAAAAEDDGDDDAGFHRLRPRYRSLAEVYADCPRIDGDGRNRSAAAAGPAVRRRKRGDFD